MVCSVLLFGILSVSDRTINKTMTAQFSKNDINSVNIYPAMQILIQCQEMQHIRHI